MKILIPFLFALFGVAGTTLGQTPAASEFLTAKPATGQSLPPYVLYHHFLGWVNSIGGSDSKANATNAHALRIALPPRVDLSDNDLQFLRSEAHLLTSDLQARDKKAALIVSEYRKEAALALKQGKPLPSVPSELLELQQERTTLLVHSYIRMQASLGVDAKSQLDHYLKNEFAPHVSISSVLSHRRPDVPPSNSTITRANQQIGEGQFE